MHNNDRNSKPICSRGYLTITSTLLLALACSLGIAQDSAQESAQGPRSQTNSSQTNSSQGQSTDNTSDQGAYGTAQQSLLWMTNSLQQMANKLDSISAKLDPNASEEEINREVKRAMREAFADILPTASLSTFQKATNEPQATQSTEGLAEVDSTWAGSDKPIWDPKTPSWVKDRVVDNEIVRVAIESSVESSAQECRIALDQQMVKLVQKVLDEHVLRHTQASQIEQLTPEFLTNQLVKADTQYELVLDRPSGTYHQLWRLVHIGPDQMEQIRRWERESVTAKRVQWVSASALGALLILASASGVTGLLAKRSQNRMERS
jgi:hypothetical protein